MTVERFFIKEAKKASDIEEFLQKELEVAGFSHAEVKRTPLGTRVIIHALRPGLVIGSGGSSIKKLTSRLGSKFAVENPHLEVEQVREAFLDPPVVAWRIARSIEKGAYFKRVANITVSRIMQAGAKGVEIRLSGKLPGSRARTWKFIAGKLRKCGQDAVDQVQVAYAKAMKKSGIVGVRVAILPPDANFCDEIKRKFVEPPVVDEPSVEVVEVSGDSAVVEVSEEPKVVEVREEPKVSEEPKIIEVSEEPKAVKTVKKVTEKTEEAVKKSTKKTEKTVKKDAEITSGKSETSGRSESKT
jgi:small subunit ribosomal protein S3